MCSVPLYQYTKTGVRTGLPTSTYICHILYIEYMPVFVVYTVVIGEHFHLFSLQ